VARRLGYGLDRIEDDEIEAPGETGRGMVWLMDSDSWCTTDVRGRLGDWDGVQLDSPLKGTLPGAIHTGSERPPARRGWRSRGAGQTLSRSLSGPLAGHTAAL